jgi:predicted rRNA methylase YqxC with S4 and FtsJ domains
MKEFSLQSPSLMWLNVGKTTGGFYEKCVLSVLGTGQLRLS